jgi:tellurite resistance protein TerC
MHSIAGAWLWLGFIAFVLLMLALDLGVFHRDPHRVTMREATVWSIVWISLALIFGAGVYALFGTERALEYLTGYVIEKSLSVDNIFVFVVIFNSFGVPGRNQHRVLFWGILGALVTRAAFILAGAAMIQRFHWVMYVFGALLLVTAIRLVVSPPDEKIDVEHNRIVKLVRRLLPTTADYRDAHFFVREGGKLLATPLLIVLVVIEATDVMFAVDSIPAIFAVTRDPFIVFTSNIFAILGLRAMYFLLAGGMRKLRYLHHGLAVILAFVGLKMLLADVLKIPIVLSLAIIASILALTVAASLLGKPAKESLGGGTIR